MRSLAEIKAPIAGVMEEFEKRFRDSMRSRVPLLDRITHYIVKRKGKQMRPMFVFFSAGLCTNEIPGEQWHESNGDTMVAASVQTGKATVIVTDKTYRAAALIELLHTATLVHDDVVDDSNERRGFFSINALWKNKIAVLVGDYLLSKGLLLSVQNDDFDLLKIVSNAVRVMSEGELLQIEKARRLDIKEEIYFEIIRQKTASLIASCCACGAASVGASKEMIEKMHQFGEYIGIAFQIKDDLFDYGSDGIIGKPTGNDIKESKMTLPLIITLNNASSADRSKIINTIKNHNTNNKKVKEVIEMVKNGDGINYAVKQMKSYQQKAYEILDTFPENLYKNSLRDLIEFTIERQH